jgi:predicted DNA-binding transcriptional regulator AlpA
MKKYSTAEAAKFVGINKATVYRWIQRKVVPSPLTEVIAGVEISYWTDAELGKLRDYKKQNYRGKGLNRRTGKKAKPK